MDEDVAKEYLTAPEGKMLSEIGEAVDVFYQKHRSYMEISRQLGIPDDFLSSRHSIFQLPEGIRWQVDNKKITIDQGCQISKLKNENDQWLLALVIVEAKQKLIGKECNNIVKKVTREGISIKEALSTFASVRFDKIVTIILPFGFDERVSLIRSAWDKHEELEDFCFQRIREGSDIDITKVANQLERLAADLRGAGKPNTTNHFSGLRATPDALFSDNISKNHAEKEEENPEQKRWQP